MGCRVVDGCVQLRKISAALRIGRHSRIQVLRIRIPNSGQVEKDELFGAGLDQSWNEGRSGEGYTVPIGAGRRLDHWSSRQGEVRRVQRAVAALIKDRSVRLRGIEAAAPAPSSSTSAPTKASTARPSAERAAPTRTAGSHDAAQHSRDCIGYVGVRSALLPCPRHGIFDALTDIIFAHACEAVGLSHLSTHGD